MRIGERLKEERERLGLSQAALGELGGVQKQAQLKYEKGERFPDARYLVALAENGLDVTYVLTGKRVFEGQGATHGHALPRDSTAPDMAVMARDVSLAADSFGAEDKSVLHSTGAQRLVTKNAVVPLPRDDQSGLTQQEVLDLVLDALHAVKRTLPATRIHAMVDAIMAWQRAGAAVTEASISDQLKLVK